MDFDLSEEVESLSQFEEWLEQLKSSENPWVGSARTECDCPLAVFLKLRTGQLIEIDRNEIRVGNVKVPHSSLSYEFVEQIDKGRRDGQPVTWFEVIKALKKARRAIE